MKKIHGMACRIHAGITQVLGIISIIILFLLAFSTPALSQFTLTEAPLTISNVLVTHTNCYAGNEGAIDLTTGGGITPYGFQWSTGEITEDISSLVADDYTVTITDANSCEIVGNWMVQAVCDPVCNGQPIYLYCVVQGCGMPGATYLWTNSSGTWTSTETDPVIQPGSLGYASDTFSVYVQYDPPIGSFSTGSCIITVRDPIGITAVQHNVQCNGGTNGEIDLTVSGGGPPYSYAWSNGSAMPDQTGLASGTYTVMVTDFFNCSHEASYTITEPETPLTISSALVTPANCDGGNEGAINLAADGGTSPYEFLWSTGEATEDVNSLIVGEYSITVTDANNCTVVGSWMVQAVCDPVCFGQPINLYCVVQGCGMPGATYFWTNSSGTWTSTETDPVIFPGTLGYTSDTFFVFVQYDPPVGSFSTGSCIITVRDSIGITGTLQDIQCRGGNEGSIDLAVSGGVSPYSCIWSNGETTLQIDSLIAGNYAVTITDQNSCTATKIFSLSQPSTYCDLVVGGQKVSNGFNECFDAKETLTIGGNGSMFLIESGGSATMIAGQVITYLPGTRVNHGGYMHAYITTDDQYCSNEKNSLVTTTLMDNPLDKKQQEPPRDQSFSVYPNPTTGLVTLDLAKTMGPGPVRVEIYSMQCEKVSSQQLAPMQKHSLSLCDRPTGIYLLRVFSEGVVKSIKIVKQ